MVGAQRRGERVVPLKVEPPRAGRAVPVARPRHAALRIQDDAPLRPVFEARLHVAPPKPGGRLRPARARRLPHPPTSRRRDLRAITAEERARFLAADAAVGYAVHDELGRYPDRAGWGR